MKNDKTPIRYITLKEMEIREKTYRVMMQIAKKNGFYNINEYLIDLMNETAKIPGAGSKDWIYIDVESYNLM